MQLRYRFSVELIEDLSQVQVPVASYYVLLLPLPTHDPSCTLQIAVQRLVENPSQMTLRYSSLALKIAVRSHAVAFSYCCLTLEIAVQRLLSPTVAEQRSHRSLPLFQ
jgi:hypothetical protein